MVEFLKTRTQCADIIKWIARAAAVRFEGMAKNGNPQIEFSGSSTSLFAISVQFLGRGSNDPTEGGDDKELIERLQTVVSEVNEGMNNYIMDLGPSDKPNAVIFRFPNSQAERIWRHLKSTPLRPAKNVSRRDWSGSQPD